MEMARKRDCPPRQDVHVVTYNVLTPFFATEADYPCNAAEDLVEGTRLTRVLSKLSTHVTRRAIICLEEVALSWAGPLRAYFAGKRFHLVLGTYGGNTSWQMGVVLAFPTDRFAPDEIRIEVLTDMVNWPVFSTAHTARART